MSVVDDPTTWEAKEMMTVRLLQSGLHMSKATHEPGHAGHGLTSELHSSRTLQAIPPLLGPIPLALAWQSSVAKVHPATVDAAALAEVLSDETTTASVTGLSLNSAGDLSAFLSALILYVVLMGVIFVVFSVARRRYPFVYAKNVHPAFELGSLPTPSNFFTGWVSAALDTDMEDVASNVGLDQAMLLRFASLGMSIMLTIGVPMILIGGLSNLMFGGNAAGDDHMSYLSFGNIQYGSWLYYPYSIVVWMVVVFVHRKICAVQADFLKLRFKWLREMERARANTVLVDGIPDEYRRDDLLHDFFERMFPGRSVKDAHCVKDSGELLVHWERRAALRGLLQEAEAKGEITELRRSFLGYGDDPPELTAWRHSQRVDSKGAYQKELVEIEAKIKDARERLEEDSKMVGGVNLSFGFVTFTERSFAEIALAVQVGEDRDTWVIETPPSPADILWKDLKQDPSARAVRELIGFGLVVGLYVAYLPLVIVITNLAELVHMGPLDSLWSVVAPTLGLQIMVAFLPTFLMIIFENFFTLKAGAWAQHKVQIWYFWFNMVFVVMIAAVGTNFLQFAEVLVSSPFEVFSLLGDTLPYATHYYCNYVVLQWFSHCMNLLRHVQLLKFKFFSATYPEEEAAVLCEPEDQHYYGIGSRSARFSTILVIGIVYGTLCPPLNLLVFINFFICRLVYGYTITFAECKKTDLGGVFWATQLSNLYVGMTIYVVCMTGVFYCRATPGEDASVTAPVIISALAIPYVIWARRRFEESFIWEHLPFSEVFQGLEEGAKKSHVKGNYMQPECLPTEDLEGVDVFDMQSGKAALTGETAATFDPGRLFAGLTCCGK